MVAGTEIHRGTEEEERLRAELRAAWSQVLPQVLSSYNFKEVPEAETWLRRVLQENVSSRKLELGTRALKAYRHLTKDQNRSTERDMEIYVIAWALEILEEAFLIVVDIMEDNKRRDGHECWYLNEEVGMISINDAFLLENLVYQALYVFFNEKEDYDAYLKILNTVAFHQLIGNYKEARLELDQDLFRFDLQNYAKVVKYKRSYFRFYLPLAMAISFAGIQDESLLKDLEKFTLSMGLHYSVTQDYLNCYGTRRGDQENQIQTGKLTWLFATALHVGNAEQKRKLLENYGKGTEETEKAVLDLYEELQIQEHYKTFAQTSLGNLKKELEEMPPVPKSVAKDLLNLL